MKHITSALLLLLNLPAFASTQPPLTVFTEKAKPQAIFNTLTFPARVESKVNAVIRSEADGAVRSVKPLGTHVTRGETLALIEHTDPVYEFAPLTVVASVRGVINEVQVTPGSLVNKGDPIVTVTDPTQLRIMIEVAASDLKYVRAGLKGELTIPGLTTPLSADVQGVSPSIDPMLGTATSELQVHADQRKLIVAGMTGQVQFKVNQHTGYLLPEYAIVYRGDEAFVRLVKDGHARRVPVKLGDRAQGQVEVLSGLNTDDVVVERASRFVPEGAAVQVEAAHE